MSIDLFYGVADIYDRYRPTYPEELINFMCSKIGINQKCFIADVGSGTGILTKELLKISGKVFAIEPNNDMRNISDINLSKFSNYESVCATAENTKLSDCSIDYITVAQAFHWFDRAKFKKECKRILKPNGQVILIWNRRDESSDIVTAIDAISQKYNPEFFSSKNHIRGVKTDNEIDEMFYKNYSTYVFSNPQFFDKERFLGLHKTASYCPNHQSSLYTNYIMDLSEFFDKNKVNAQLLMPNNTICYIGYV